MSKTCKRCGAVQGAKGIDGDVIQLTGYLADNGCRMSELCPQCGVNFEIVMNEAIERFMNCELPRIDEKGTVIPEKEFGTGASPLQLEIFKAVIAKLKLAREQCIGQERGWWAEKVVDYLNEALRQEVNRMGTKSLYASRMTQAIALCFMAIEKFMNCELPRIDEKGTVIPEKVGIRIGGTRMNEEDASSAMVNAYFSNQEHLDNLITIIPEIEGE